MKISLEWICQFVDISDLVPETIAKRITMATAEIEGIFTQNRSIDGVLVAELIDIESLPNNPNLKLVTVDCGCAEFKTVCGALNVRVGLKSAFAPEGVKIDGQHVAKAMVQGHRSEGILCSAKELGMSGFHEGVLEIPNSVNTGVLLSELIPNVDTILEIDNKSLTHRPDLWGHYGIAREIAAVFGRELKELTLEALDAYDGLPPYPLEIKDKEACPCYCCMEMDNIAHVPSPLFIQSRLHAIGQRTFNLIIDLTNYIMFELGQPMHAFDGSKLRAVRVGPFGKQGTFITLDGEEREMLPNDLMIWNEKEPVAIGGIMGGFNSEIGENTTRLLLESANFKGACIRRTALRLGLRSEASQRFEKGQPPANTKIAVARFLFLMQKADMKPKILSRLTMEGDLKQGVRSIKINTSFFNNRIGMDIPYEKILSILNSLGFEAHKESSNLLKIGIPPFRSENDISIPQDIIEEISRIYGYDNIRPKMPTLLMQPVIFNDRLRTEHKARRLLAASHGFMEVHTYSWYDDLWLKSIGFDPGDTLVLKNPNAEHQGRLRTTLMPNLLALVKKNFIYKDGFRIFELGRVYYPLSNSKSKEATHLCGISYMQVKGYGFDLEEHFRSVKGVIEDLAAQTGQKIQISRPSEDGEMPWKVARNYIQVIINNQPVGSLGFLPEALADKLATNAQVVWFELEFDKFNGPVYPEVNYAPVSRYPGSWFDFSIVWDSRFGFAQLVNTLEKFEHPLVMRSEFLYMYKGKGLEAGKGSYTFRYWIGSKDRTLTGKECEIFQEAFLSFLKSEQLEIR